MQKETTNELKKMQLLMERMDNHYTRDEAEYLLKEAIGKQRVQVTRDQILDILDKQDDEPGGRFVSFIYVKPVSVYKKRSSIDIPSMQGSLERYKDNSDAEWHKSLSDFSNDENSKKNPIGAIVVAQRYVIHWTSPKRYDDLYGAYAEKLSNLRQKYGIARDTAGALGDNRNQRTKDDWGTTNQTGNRSRDFNMVNSTVKITNYIVDDAGNIISEIPNDIVKTISSQKKTYSIEAEVAKALADNPEALREYEQAKAEISKDFKGQNFLLDRILSIVATVGDMSYYYINDKLLSPIVPKGEVNVNQGDMVKIAKEQLNQSFNDIEASKFAN